jgi:hypothetical protein
MDIDTDVFNAFVASNAEQLGVIRGAICAVAAAVTTLVDELPPAAARPARRKPGRRATASGQPRERHLRAL